ncbi:MAG TPA: lipoate--protein ligase family protein, partial [Chitinophagales bacterium]|nr:lipoate--protein ligase family protein [Chitinophagales bacterium]
MKLVDTRGITDPFVNLAIEDYLLHNANTAKEDLLLLYVNEPSIIIGRNQNIYREVNFEFLRNGVLKIARRITGGGAVYHDMGNLNFAFITSFNDKKINNYPLFNAPLIKAFTKAGIDLKTDERNNITCRGKKVSGNAQFTNRKNIISHGTLLFNANLATLR